MLVSWFFNAILTTYQRWFSENFVKICLILTSKISFEKFGKNIDFRKSPKKFGQNSWREISFFTFSELLGPKERREGETFPEIWKKVKITAPYSVHTVSNSTICMHCVYRDGFWEGTMYTYRYVTSGIWLAHQTYRERNTIISTGRRRGYLGNGGWGKLCTSLILREEGTMC